MATRTLDVALWEYRDHDGRRQRAYYRETFDLPDSEAERGERAGVFAPSPQVNHDEDTLPAKASTNRALMDWLIEHRGADPVTIKSLTKAELWQLIEQPESAVPQHVSASQQP